MSALEWDVVVHGMLSPLGTTNVFFNASHTRLVHGFSGIPQGVVVDSLVLGTQHLLGTPGVFTPESDCFYFEPRPQPAGLAMALRLRNTTSEPLNFSVRLLRWEP